MTSIEEQKGRDRYWHKKPSDAQISSIECALRLREFVPIERCDRDRFTVKNMS